MPQPATLWPSPRNDSLIQSISLFCNVSELPLPLGQKLTTEGWSRQVRTVDFPTKWLPQEFDRG